MFHAREPSLLRGNRARDSAESMCGVLEGVREMQHLVKGGFCSAASVPSKRSRAGRIESMPCPTVRN
jgi:hypothetical protein